MFTFGIMIIPQGSIADIVAVAQTAEEAGFDFCLIADEGFTYDVYALMTTIVAHTKKLRVSPITNPHTRHPAVTASALASVNTLAEGRVFLSVVAGGSLVLGPMNIPLGKPVVACREMIQIVRALLSGQKITMEGNVFKLTGAQLQIPTQPIDIWVMGRGPKMMEMAGACADVAVVQNRLGIRKTIQHVQKGADETGRSVKLAYLGDLAFDQSNLDKMRPHYTYIIPDSPPIVWEELGLSADWVAHLKQVREAEGEQSAARLISDDLLRRCVISGTPEECAHDLRSLVQEFGFNHFIFPVTTLDPNYAAPLIQQAARIYRMWI
jgi:5,10-methylenetetrahydromethanopterin reductase